MIITDIRGHALSGADRDAAHAYSDAVRQFSIFAGDPVSAADRLIEAQPGFVMAHALKAWLYLLGTAPAAIPVARDVGELLSRLDSLSPAEVEQALPPAPAPAATAPAAAPATGS